MKTKGETHCRTRHWRDHQVQRRLHQVCSSTHITGASIFSTQSSLAKRCICEAVFIHVALDGTIIRVTVCACAYVCPCMRVRLDSTS